MLFPPFSLTVHPSVVSKGKRAIDILGSLVGLAIMGIILIPLAIIMYIDSPGAIFYTQIRCGLNGKTFKIWKFRSMIQGAEALKDQIKNEANGYIFKNEHDPRITRVGHFLRHTSLDEFPQFWNVLKGEMSLVGTRPPTPDEVIHYNSYHWQRLNVKPGITGEWQVHGRSCVKDFEEIVKMDLDYQEKWSIRYDILLLVKTLWVVFQKRGAF